MSRSLEEVIRIKLESAGVENVDALVKAFSELEQSGELTQAELSGLVDKLTAVTDAAGNVRGIEAAIDSYRSLGEQQKALAKDADAAGLALQLSIKQEEDSRRILAEKVEATRQAEAALEEYRKSVDANRFGIQSYNALLSDARKEQTEANKAWGEAAKAVKIAHAEYDGVADKVAKLNERLGDAGKIISNAGLSTDDLAKAQAELATRADAAGASVAAMVRDAEAAAAANRELARATAEAAAAATKAEKEFQDAFRALGGDGALRDTAAEMERLEQAYSTLASSGKLSTEQLSRAQEELQKRLAKLREGTAEYRAEQERASQAQAKAAAFAEELAQETARAQAEADEFAAALKRQGDAADKAAKESAALNSEGERGSIVFDKLKGVLAGVAAAFSFAKIAGAIKGLFEEASAAQQATAQLEAALASTGNAAGLTAEELRAMALQMRTVTNYTDEQIQSAQTRLLSYTDVARNEFPRAMEIILDQSARLGMSVEQSAEIVGKALQSPSKAMAALADQGFVLSAQQKELLKSLEATGRTAEAQAIIMDMLAESYGGAALAQRMGTLAGALKGLGDAVTDVRRNLVSEPVLAGLSAEINATSQTIRDFSESPAFEDLKESFDYAFGAALESVSLFREGASLPALAAELSGVVKSLGDVMTIINYAERETGAASKGWIAFRQGLDPLGPITEGLSAALDKLAKATRDTSAELPAATAGAANATPVFGALADAARAVAERMGEIREAAVAANNGISAAAEGIAEKLRGAADSAAAARKEVAGLVAGIEDMTPGEIGDVAMAIAQVASESERAGRNVRDGLVASLKTLTGEQLLAFGQASQQAFGTFNTGAEKAALVSQTVLLTALERLGVKGAELGVAITDSGRDIIATFETIASSAIATSQQIDAAFRAALNAAATTQEAAALKTALEAAFAAGKIGADQLAAGLQAVQTRMAAIKAEVDPLASAFDALGIKSQQSLNAARDAARVAFDQITHGARQGKAALSDTQAAFEAYARAELAAAQNSNAATRQQVENMLRLKGGAIGATEALERLGLVGAQAPGTVQPPADRATSSLHGLAAAADAASGSVSGMGDSAERAGEQLDGLGRAAENQAYSLGEVSEEAAKAYESLNRYVSANSGTSGRWASEMNRLTARINEQRDAYRDEMEQIEANSAANNGLASYLEAVRREYNYLSEAQQKAMAQARKQADEASGTANAYDRQTRSLRDGNDALRERSALLNQQTQTQTTKSEIEIVFTAKAAKIEFDPSQLTDSHWRQIASKVIEVIKRDMP